MRIFLDANVLFSAAKSEGAISELLKLLKDWGHELIADLYVVEEAHRNLAIRYPESLGRFGTIIEGIIVCSDASDERVIVETVELVEKDRPVLAGAICSRCSVLVTGDSTHFGHLYDTVIQGVRVLSPRGSFALLHPK